MQRRRDAGDDGCAQFANSEMRAAQLVCGARSFVRSFVRAATRVLLGGRKPALSLFLVVAKLSS